MRSALLLLTAASALVACSTPAPAPPPPPSVTVAEVIARDVREWDDFTGRLEAVDQVEIRPRVSGFIERVAFAEGREVRKGDVLFVIDQRPYAAAVERAEAELARARTRAALAAKEVERADRLVKVQAISREEFETRVGARDEAEASIRGAEAAVTTARLDLGWTEVRAPISGRVGRAEVTEGNVVQAGPPSSTLLTTVVSLDPIYAVFEGDEQTYLRYQQLARDGLRPSSRTTRNAVEMGLADQSDTPYKGYVDFVDNRLDPQSGTITARAVFSNRDRSLTPGLFARVRLIGSAPYRATLIRDAAVATDQDRKYVMVLGADSTLAYRPVQVGRLIDGLRVVREGVKPGEKVVVVGLARVRPGLKVTASTVPMDSTAVAPAAASAVGASK